MSRARKKAGSKARAVRVTTFDPAEFLDSEAVIAEYLSAAIEDPIPYVFLRAMANVARARWVRTWPVRRRGRAALPASSSGS
jgi:hypothetical protein